MPQFYLSCVRCKGVFDNTTARVPAWDAYRRGPVCEECEVEEKARRWPAEFLALDAAGL